MKDGFQIYTTCNNVYNSEKIFKYHLWLVNPENLIHLTAYAKIYLAMNYLCIIPQPPTSADLAVELVG